MSSRIGYRIWQFFQSFHNSLTEQDWTDIRRTLSASELELFQQLPGVDQNHSLRVFRTLLAANESEPDLLKAALLHDLGKIKYPLRRWERVFAVLAKAFFPGLVRDWGSGDAVGMRRSLVVLSQHPLWGAGLAADAGTNARTVWLIQNHEEDPPRESSQNGDLALLLKLQGADNQN
jgi:hypothetical protein